MSAVERECVEMVFGLGGGELNDDAWQGFAYNYDGLPSYIGSRDIDVACYDEECGAVTVVACALFSPVQAPKGWRIVSSFRSSGEVECICRGCALDGVWPEDCPYCEGGGFVYLGEGWCEVTMVPMWGAATYDADNDFRAMLLGTDAYDDVLPAISKGGAS